jgi:geranylgeranyl reductase
MPEIVIVGAGPGGLAAAKMLAEAGKDVLVLERNKIPGLKVCAGGLTNLELSYGIPKSILERQFNRVLLDLEGTEVSLKDSGKLMCTVRRTNLGKFQAKQAQKAGAKIRYGTKVTEIGKNFVKVGKEKIPFKFLIGADGSASIVREYLGLKSDKLAIGIEYEVKGRFKDLEVIFNRKLFGSLYAWIFPYKNSAMIGAGCYSNEMSAVEIKKNLDEWCAEKGYKIKGKKLIAAPLNMSYKGFKFKNVFLVGDAAGFTMDLTGKGMGPAIISGEEVAQGILDPKYDFPRIEELLEIKASQEKTRELIATRPYLTKFCYLLMPALIHIPQINHKILRIAGLQ